MTSSPVDPTTSGAWQALTDLADDFAPDLRAWFAEDEGRADRYTFQAADLTVDLSKNLVTEEVLGHLLEVARTVDVPGRYASMIRGEHINVTEDRAVLHTALRRPAAGDLVPAAPLTVDGQDVDHDVQEVLAKIATFANAVRDGSWTGVTGNRVETVVNIGIGGSDLGPVMVYEALKPYLQAGLAVRFVSNIDPSDLFEKTADLDPETTLFIVASKTFGTLETLTNARLARQWLWDGLSKVGAIEETEGSRRDAVSKHFVAVSTALDKVEAFGIDPTNAFGFWDWVGGRYSVDSAIGTSIAIAIGPDGFADFLAGFHAVDEHMRTAPLESNVPVLMGMLNVWYSNFLGAQSHAVLPYAQYLHRFPAYLQQLTMESNGKSVRWDGTPVVTDTGEVFWGEPGTNGQHAFYQLIHQGTSVIPADFLIAANPHENMAPHHAKLVANVLAQSEALMLGKSKAEVVAELTAQGLDKDAIKALTPHKMFPGNRPSNTLIYPKLTPEILGSLVALYEHKVFVQGTVWNVNSYDQWGVELGKQLAKALLPKVVGTATNTGNDASTKGLLAHYHKLRG